MPGNEPTREINLNDVYLRIGNIEGSIKGIETAVRAEVQTVQKSVEDLDATVMAKCMEQDRRIENVAAVANENRKLLDGISVEKAEAKGMVKGGISVGKVAMVVILWLLTNLATALGASQLTARMMGGQSQQPGAHP